MKHINFGFTQIELVIALAIIGILVAGGRPQYQKYVAGVTVSNDGEGMITAIFGSGNHAGKFLRLPPEPTDGAISLMHHRQRLV